jgi:hypothetical protein
MSLYDNLRMMLSKLKGTSWLKGNTKRGLALRSLVIIFGIVVIVFAFQNCTNGGFENNTLNLSSTALSSSSTATSFLYDVSVNQVGFMSCQLQGDPGQNGTYFTFRVGAYDNTGVPSSSLNISPAGLAFSPTFQSSWGAYNSNQLSALETKLMSDTTSWSSQLQLSLRQTGAPATNLMTLPNYGTSGTTYPGVTPMMTSMGTDGVAAGLAANFTGATNYFPMVSDYYSRSLDGSLSLGSAPGTYYSSLLSDLSGSYLALGFASTATGSTDLIGVQDSKGNATGLAFGKGFRMGFGHMYSQQNQQNILTTLAEYDMSTAAPVSGHTWDCNYHLKIVRAEDRANSIWVSATRKVAACPVESYADLYDPNHPERPAILHALRRLLPASQWDINVTRGCVVPHQADACYQQVSSSAPIVYDEYFFPTTNFNTLQFSGCGYGTGQFQCANYLTMCIRH